MDKWAIIIYFLVIVICCIVVGGITSSYYKRQLSSKSNEYERAVRQAAYNKTHLCLDDGTFYDVKIYRMDGNREFYVVKSIK